jgi:glycine/D-amino acid oxidase-like deaminating enzyme
MKVDDQSEYGSTWYAGATALPPFRAALNYDLDVDVCVVGGGLAGLTAAREAARSGWSVAILEARRIAWNASGRNSGFVLPGFSAPVEKIVERVGLQATRSLWELSQSGVQYIRDTIAEIGDAGIIEGDGWLDVAKKPDLDRILERVRLLEEMGMAVEGWPTERVRDTLRSSRYFEAVYFPDGFQINPLAYAQGLAGAALQAGVRMFEHTPVIAADLDGVRKRIETPHGRVRAGHVVLAGNIHLGGIARTLADTLIPVTACTGVTQPLGNRLAQAVAFRGAISDSHYANYHYRIVGGDRLLWTGSAAAGPRLMRKWFERAVRATYPQLGPVRFEYFWPADTGFAVHRMPQIGEVQRGVWLASAFGAHGLNTSAMAGNLIARAIATGDDGWRRFLPFELVWAGGPAGRVVARTTEWCLRQNEAALALAARQRDEMRRKREEKKSQEKKADGRLPLTKITLRSGYDAMAALKRLKSSFTADDRPIDAPEAMPAAGVDGPRKDSQT